MVACMVPADRPAALAETVKVLVAPAVVDKLKASQLALVVAVKVVATLLVNVTVFESGAGLPIVWVNDKDDGDAVRFVAAPEVTVRPTVILMDDCPPVIVIVPW